jgi:hypothetical protein
MGLDSLFKPKGKLMLQSLDNALPGAVIPVDIRVTADEDINPREIRAELIGDETYYVRETHRDSKGHVSTHIAKRNETFAKIVQTVVEGPSLPQGTDRKWSSPVQIPANAAPTCCGKVVNIRWTLKAVLDVPKYADLSEEKPLNVFSRPGQGGDISIVPVEKSFGEVTLVIIAPPVATVSHPLKGQLTLQVKEKLNIRGIRVELVQVEEAGAKNSSEVISTAQISGERSFNPGESPVIEFSLDIPAGAPPTVIGSRSRLDWKIRAVLDRKMKSDFNVERDLVLYNALTA